MNLLCLSSFPPKSCGIAEFHQSIIKELLAIHPTIVIQSIAINEGDTHVHGYPHDVIFQIRKNYWEDYQQAAKLINESSADVVLFEHEFGLFGGFGGGFGEQLLHLLKKPVVIIAHTIPLRSDAHKPKHKEKFFLTASSMAAKIVVMLPDSKQWLIDHGVAKRKVVHIDHGAPDLSKIEAIDLHSSFGIPREHMIAMSFGLFHKSKGIHLAIEAMHEVKNHNVPVSFLIFSEPLRGEENQAYVSMIEKRIQNNPNIQLHKGYVETQRLYTILRSVDFGMLPYTARSHVSSGVTSYFLAAGKPIITTRFPYAVHICRSGGALFVPFNNAEKIVDAIETFVINKTTYNQKKKEAESIGKQILWKKKAQEFWAVLQSVT